MAVSWGNPSHSAIDDADISPYLVKMYPARESAIEFLNQNRSTLNRAALFFITVLAAIVLYSILAQNSRLLMGAALTIAGLALAIIVCHPRLAVSTYIIALFFQLVLVESLPLTLIDVAAGIVILAAFFDQLAAGKLPRQLPLLSFNFLILLVAILVCGLAAYNPINSIHPFARVSLYFVSFLALYRLSRHVSTAYVIRFFFWTCVASALAVVIPFIIAGGTIRSFGLSGNAFGALAMTALPIGICLFLWSTKSRALIYATGSLIVFGSLVATQTRLSMLFALLVSGLALWLSSRRSKELADRSAMSLRPDTVSKTARSIRRRILAGLGLFAIAVILVILMRPEFFETVYLRFERIFTFYTGGTVRLRLTLWRIAFEAFLDNPVFGIGPGSFRYILSIYPELRMESVGYYVRGLSAHNLFLHYLAETGLIGTPILIALFIRQFNLSRSIWKNETSPDSTPFALILYLMGVLFLITTFVEAAWMWGQLGFTFVLFLSLIARESNRRFINDTSPGSTTY